MPQSLQAGLFSSDQLLPPTTPDVPPLVHSGPTDHSDSGIMIVSSSNRILHMNATARSLMGLFNNLHESSASLELESMPSILQEFCRDILAELQQRKTTSDWAHFEIRRVCHMVSPPLLLRGFGMPSSVSQGAHMILTLQPCSVSPTQRPLK